MPPVEAPTPSSHVCIYVVFLELVMFDSLLKWPKCAA